MSLAVATCPCRANALAAFATAFAGMLAAVAMVIGCAPSPAVPPALALPRAPIATPAAQIATPDARIATPDARIAMSTARAAPTDKPMR